MKQGGYREARVPLGDFAVPRAGFTIVEVMIVLAISGLLFLSAVILIGGRTSKTQFTTAANNLKVALQQVINETATGYFPNSGNFTCTAGVNAMPVLSNGSQQQGTNGGCIFLGKAVQFGATDAQDKFITYAITGNRLQNGTQTEVTSLAQAFPEAVAPGTGTNTTLTSSVITTTPLENGFKVGSMTYSGGTTGGFAFLSTLASYTASGSSCNGVCSGAQSLGLYVLSSSSVNSVTSKGFVDILDGGSARYVPASQVNICFNSGTTNQSVVYVVGGNSSDQSVTMTVQAGTCP